MKKICSSIIPVEYKGGNEMKEYIFDTNARIKAKIEAEDSEEAADIFGQYIEWAEQNGNLDITIGSYSPEEEVK